MLTPARTPILIGAGQVTRNWDDEDTRTAPSPQSLAREAVRAALKSTGRSDAAGGLVDRVIFVRSMLDSVEGSKHPFGRCANPPGTLARDIGVSPARTIYSVVGGDQPQALVNEAAEAIFAGEARGVLLAGAEATAAMKRALRQNLKLDWSDSAEGEFEDRGLGAQLLSEYEIANGLGMPTQTYPAFEHALRSRLGLSRAEHLALMSELWESLSKVAATNPYAQYPHVRTREFLATPGQDNYPVADPYLKWHVAQDAVNQGAAVLLTSVGEACAAGIDPARWVYLHGYAQAKDLPVSGRVDLSRSRSIELVLAKAMGQAGKTTTAIAHFDLYSCFPCAVILAAEALGLDWRETPATVTGGLSFFGGPGNNYSMHAIATMSERLRAEPGTFGLVLANGGFLSKQAVGVYSTDPVANWQPQPSGDIERAIHSCLPPRLLNETTDATVETFTVTYRKGRPSRGYVIARNGPDRILARARTGHRATLAALAVEGDPVGQVVHIVSEGGTNFISAPHPVESAGNGFLSRNFEHVQLRRDGRCLEVTLNRPNSMNSLHSAAHFELHEIWDEFERDQGLWVAVLTGAGVRAFCSGNDLKTMARGGDMSSPPSGFGGLCSRFDRTKPIIAAVNGVAMGGGMEIVLACDLAVAGDDAQLALPEVKVGLYAAAGGVQRLTRQIGRKPAMELILTGRTIGAQRALELGIVNQVVPAGSALDAARQLAREILANSPTAVQASKRALNALDGIESLDKALASTQKIIGRLVRTNDFREGVSAFLEKRQPEWSGA